MTWVKTKNMRDMYLFSDPVVNRNSYSQLCRFLEGAGRTKISAPPFPTMGFMTRGICKVYDVLMGRPIRNKANSYHELKFDLANLLSAKDGVFHFLFGDNHIEFLTQLKKRRIRPSSSRSINRSAKAGEGKTSRPFGVWMA